MPATEPVLGDEAGIPIVAEPSFSWWRLIFALIFFGISLGFSAYTGFNEGSWGYSTGFFLIGLIGALTINSGANASLESSFGKGRILELARTHGGLNEGAFTAEDSRANARRLTWPESPR